MRRTWIAVVLLVLLSAWTVGAADVAVDPGTESGGPVRAPLDIDRTLEPEIVGEYNDIGGTPSPWAAAVLPPITPEMTDMANQATEDVKAGTPTTASMILARLDLASRMNAMIELEPINSTAEAFGAFAAEAVTLWNKGDFDLALAKIEQIEASGARFAVGISWREPIVSAEPEIYQDVRVGGANTDAQDAAIDYDRTTGNIFIAVSWGPDNASPGNWTLNRSTNGGASWAETYAWTAGTDSPLIDMAVVDGFVYVSYVSPLEANKGRTRRNFATTGTSDTVYNFHDVVDVSPATVTDISIGGNADSADNRIYMATIDSSNNLRYFWDVASDGQTFTEASPAVSASRGLDMHWNWNDIDKFLYFSYLGTDGAVHALGRGSGGIWYDSVVEATYTGHVSGRTRVSAHDNTVFVVYTHDMTNGQGVRYRISYNDGVSWNYGDLYAPGSGEPLAYQPDISARSGQRSMAIYNREEGTLDNAYHLERSGFAPGSWTDPFDFANQNAYTAGANFIQYIGSLCVKSYGLAYLTDGSGDGQLLYFDLSDVRGFFCDGFESGTTSGWD